jgi:hypothetical protein
MTVAISIKGLQHLIIYPINRRFSKKSEEVTNVQLIQLLETLWVIQKCLNTYRVIVKQNKINNRVTKAFIHVLDKKFFKDIGPHNIFHYTV